MWKKFLRISFQVGSMPSIEPNVGLEVMTLRSRPKLRSRVGGLTNCATQAPLNVKKNFGRSLLVDSPVF